MFDSIIAFFTENPFIIFIVLGIVSSLLGRDKKEKSRAPQKEHKQQPTVKQTLQDYQKKYESTFEKGKDVFEQTNPKKLKETVSSAKVKKSATNEIASYYEDYFQKQEEIETQANQNELIGSIHNQPVMMQVQKKDLQSYSKNQLVNGLIMSEILGPPRAKKKLRK